MTFKPEDSNRITGGCLCGAVRYEINDKLRGIVNCHCSKCRKFHGNYGAYTSIKFTSMTLSEQRGLKWFQSITDETLNVYRGFCTECGSSLFWHPTRRAISPASASKYRVLKPSIRRVIHATTKGSSRSGDRWRAS